MVFHMLRSECVSDSAVSGISCAVEEPCVSLLRIGDSWPLLVKQIVREFLRP
jgi:hypothetical protein